MMEHAHNMRALRFGFESAVVHDRAAEALRAFKEIGRRSRPREVCR
jgi:hypothetical protein